MCRAFRVDFLLKSLAVLGEVACAQFCDAGILDAHVWVVDGGM